MAASDAPSNAVVQACGVIATVLLVLMLLPQVWQLYRTRRADELSHVFLGLMNFGLAMLSCYNLFLELRVFFVAGLLQLALCLLTQAGKVWADRYQRRLHASQAGGRLERALSLRSGAGLEWSKFAAGAEAAFPLLRPAPSHAAQHLLLDARLPATAGAAGAAAGAESGAEPASFAAVAELLRGALADTGLLQRAAALAPGAAQAQQARQGAAQAQQGGEAETALFPCHNGYAALVWHADTASLSMDCLAVTAQSMRSMGAAAEAFSAALAQIYPGSKVAACSLGRLPAGGGSSGGGGS